MGGTQAAVSGVLAALLAVQRGGRGRFVDISMAHEVLRHHVLAAITLKSTGRVPAAGRDLLCGGAPCYAVYRTSDGRHLAVGALEAKFWQAVSTTVGRPEWGHQHWSSGLEIGSPASMALKAEVAALIASRPLAHWTTLFEPVDACVTPVLRLDETLSHPLFASRA